MELYNTVTTSLAQEQITTLNLEDLLSISFIVIDDLYQHHFPNAAAHRPGVNSKMADSEVITIAWVGELTGIDSERAWYSLVNKEFNHLFPYLPERSRFNRRRRHLWAVSDKLRNVINNELPLCDIVIADSLPVPICDFKRAHFSTSPLKCQNAAGLRAAYGHCDTKGLGTFLGFRVHLLVSYEGLPLGVAVANADIDERDVLWVMSGEGHYHLIIGDKGYVSENLCQTLLELDGVVLLAQRRENQKRQYTLQLKRCINRVRKRVETTISQLEEQFNLSRVRARSHWGVLTRIIDKLSAFSLGVFLNHCLGRPLVALKDLVFA